METVRHSLFPAQEGGGEKTAGHTLLYMRSRKFAAIFGRAVGCSLPCAPSRLVPCRAVRAVCPAVLASPPFAPRPRLGLMPPLFSSLHKPERCRSAKGGESARVRVPRPARPVPSPVARCSGSEQPATPAEERPTGRAHT